MHIYAAILAAIVEINGCFNQRVPLPTKNSVLVDPVEFERRGP
jgi:hypothetical protein